MIFALADDFSGAAEIAGIGLRYGLKSILQTELDFTIKADMLVLDSDTRSMNESDALQKIYAVAGQIKESSFEWVYKKIDSVLRGHVLSELRLLMSELNIKTAIIAPANPTAGRTITNGRYYIDGIPLNKTGFAADPEYPAKSSDVKKLLGSMDADDVFYPNEIGLTHTHGITIGRMQTRNDLRGWAKALPSNGMPVGSSEFLENILETKGYQPTAQDKITLDNRTGKRLVVLGSAGKHTAENLARFETAGFVVCTWPGSISDLTDQAFVIRWVESLASVYRSNDNVVLTAGLPLTPGAGVPVRIAEITGMVVRRICSRLKIRYLFIEGGSTGAQIVRNFGWKTLQPVVEFSTGVVGLQFPEKENMTIIVKPGSYPWPDFDFFI